MSTSKSFISHLLDTQPDRARVATDVLKRSDKRMDLVYPPMPSLDGLSSESDVEEFIMDVQGYVVEKDLPPVTQHNQ